MTSQMVAADRDINDHYPIFDEGLPVTHDRKCLALELSLDDSILDRKLQALRCHHSQTRDLIESIGLDRYRRWVATEQFVEASSDERERCRRLCGGGDIVEGRPVPE